MRVTRVTSRSGGSIIKKLGFDAENVLLVRFYTWLVYNVVSFLHVACVEWIGSLRDRRLTSRRRCRAIRHSLFKSFSLRISTMMRTWSSTSVVGLNRHAHVTERRHRLQPNASPKGLPSLVSVTETSYPPLAAADCSSRTPMSPEMPRGL